MFSKSKKSVNLKKRFITFYPKRISYEYSNTGKTHLSHTKDIEIA